MQPYHQLRALLDLHIFEDMYRCINGVPHRLAYKVGGGGHTTIRPQKNSYLRHSLNTQSISSKHVSF